MSKAYPMISERNWWALRESFNKKIPGTITTSYLVQALSLPSESGARSNLILPLQQMCIIDKTGKPTERAYLWRDDDKYASVCQEILKEIYPEEIVDLLGLGVSKEELVKWFMSNNQVGTSSAQKVSSTLNLIYMGSIGQINNKNEEQLIKSPADNNERTKTKQPHKRKEDPVKSPPNSISAPICINININIGSESKIETIREILRTIKEI